METAYNINKQLTGLIIQRALKWFILQVNNVLSTNYNVGVYIYDNSENDQSSL